MKKKCLDMFPKTYNRYSCGNMQNKLEHILYCGEQKLWKKNCVYKINTNKHKQTSFNSKYLPATVYNTNKENSLYYNSMQLCLCLKFESSEQNILHFEPLNVIQLRVCLKFESSPCLSRRKNGTPAAGLRRQDDSVRVSQCQ